MKRKRLSLRSTGAAAKRARKIRKERYLLAYAQTGRKDAAMASAGITSRSVLTAWRNRDPVFAAAEREAGEEAADRLEGMLYIRGGPGYEEPVIYQGQLQYRKDHEGKSVLDAEGKPIPLAVTKFDTTAAIFLLNGMRPEKYRQRVEHGVTPDAVQTLADLVRRA